MRPSFSASSFVFRASVRCRLRCPLPHGRLQSPQFPHARQTQNVSAEHPPEHFPYSSEVPASHGCPPFLDCCRMRRQRILSPAHPLCPPLQAPQSLHGPHLQSSALLTTHSCMLHCLTSTRLSSQGWPPAMASTMISRSRRVWPPSQSAVHFDHSSQSPSLQSSGWAGSQPGSFLSTQGAISLLVPSQGAPWPRWYISIRRHRRFVASQTGSLFLVHSVQEDHSLQTQSLSGTQLMSALQLTVSLERPVTGLPHSFAVVLATRLRNLVPPSQEAEQAFHSSHSPHSPSTQTTSSHGCVLHGSVSSLSFG
mmetsp:Transcript_12160/g.36126  ORF Transcript_12160/g.36126 Transcript_12160/m.36126 type:complete len:309 (+) Transcript_12160:328-1254(+)